MNIDKTMNSGWTAIAVCRFTICVLLCAFVLSGDLIAQDNYSRQEPPRKKSAMEKLSEINQKLKQSLKENLFGSSGKGQPEQSGRLDNGSYERTSQQQARHQTNEYQAPRRSDDYRSPQDSSRSQSQNSNQRASQAQYQQEIDYDRAPQQYDDYSELQHRNPERMDPRLNPIPENRFRQSEQQMAASDRREEVRTSQQYDANQDPRRQQAINGSNARPPQGEHYGARSGMPAPLLMQQQGMQRLVAQPYQQQQQQPLASMPQQYQPLPQPGRAFPPNGEYRSGHFRNSSAVTQQQFDQQETATQRALRLRAENQSLMDIRKSITAENKRLRDQLREKNALLEEIESAIMAARTELQNANQNNATLNEHIAKLEAENAQQLSASTRQLNAIRKKLDDVLMLEMTSK